MRVPLIPQKLISPDHTLPANAPSRGVARVTPQPIHEDPAKRAAKMTKVMTKGREKEAAERERSRTKLSNIRQATQDKARAVLVSEAEEDAVDHVGVFIKLPDWLGDQFPSLGKEDSSPPHCTVLYVGKCGMSQLAALRDAVRDVARNCEPFTLDVTDYGEFTTMQPGKKKVIPHMVPRVLTGAMQLADLHEKLWAACEKNGITCDHYRDGPFKPHITLAYLDPDKTYDGPRPQGRFAVRYLDLWIGEDRSRVPLGNAARGGPDMPKAELVADAMDEGEMMEGVFDPFILKAVFLAGGGGSGKGFVSNVMFGTMKDQATTSMGLKSVNSDDVLTFLARRGKLDLKRELGTDRGQAMRVRAKSLSNKRLDYFIDGRLGLIIDGTARRPEKILKIKKRLESLGYDCSMVFVNTSLEVALQRNASRARVVPEKILRAAHADVQQARGSFKRIFGRNFAEIDNSKRAAPSEVARKLVPQFHRTAMRFLSQPVRNPRGKAWIEAETAGLPAHMKRKIGNR